MAELPHHPLLGLYSGAIVHGDLSYNVKCYNAWGKLNVSNPRHNHQFHHGDLTSDLTSFYKLFSVYAAFVIYPMLGQQFCVNAPRLYLKR